MKMRLRTVALILVLLACAVPVRAQEAGSPAVASAQASATRLKIQMSQGLKVEWRAASSVAGDMISARITNSGSQAAEVSIGTGMVLEPLAAGQQRVILEGGARIKVPPGATVTRQLRGYCLDQGLATPTPGQGSAYSLATDATQYAAEIQIVATGLRLANEKRLNLPLPPLQRRTVDLQRALWARPGGGNPATRESIERDLKEEVAQEAVVAGSPSRSVTVRPPNTAEMQKMSDRLYGDIELILREALKP